MARSIRDDLKRKAAQAVNHLAQSVLDINEIYKIFTEYEKPEAEHLKMIMLGISAARDALLAFVKAVWALDEEDLISYM